MNEREDCNKFLIDSAVNYLFIDRVDLFAQQLGILYTNCKLDERIEISKQLGTVLTKRIVEYKNDKSKFAF